MARSRDSKHRPAGIIAACLVLLAVVFFSSPFAPYVRSIYKNMYALREGSNPQYAGMSRAALIAQLNKDERSLSLVRYQSVLYGMLADENAKLRQALNAGPPPRSILARVISRPPQSLYDTLLIDQGSESGVQKGDFAEYQGIALGTVASVGKGTALIELFSAPGEQNDVLVGKTNAIAIANGMGGGAFELAVPNGVQVANGDTIRSAGTEPGLLAVVANISSTSESATMTLRAHSPVSFSDLDFIEIVPHTP